MSSLSCFNGSFLSDDSECSEQNGRIDFQAASRCFNIISKIEHPSILDTVGILSLNPQWPLALLIICVVVDFNLYIDNGTEFSTGADWYRDIASIFDITIVSRIPESEE